MRRRSLPPTALGVLLAAAACATSPDDGPTPRQRIEAAEQLLQAGDWNTALDALDPLADEQCPPRLRDRRDLAVARAEVGLGELWDAFRTLERFSDDYPHSELRGEAVDRDALGRRFRGG